MNILFVSNFKNNPNSGAAGSLIMIGQNIEQLGHKVSYIWSSPVRRIKSPYLYGFFELPFTQYRQIKKALDEVQYDVVMVSQPYSWWAAKKLKKKYPSTQFVNRSHGWESRIAPINWQITFDKSATSANIKNKVTHSLLKLYSYFTVKYFDKIICASSSDTDFLKTNYPDFAYKIFGIGYGLDERFIGLPVRDVPNKRLGFLFAGQYVVRKGTKDLAEAFRKLVNVSSEFTLTFVIDKDSVSAAESDFDFLPADCLQVMSWISRDELREMYKAKDVFLMPSYGEGYGKTTLEAMACGMCCIGYSEGALQDIGIHKQNALLSQPGDLKGLFENIEFAIKNPMTVNLIGKHAHANVQSVTWFKNAKKTIEMLNDNR